MLSIQLPTGTAPGRAEVALQALTTAMMLPRTEQESHQMKRFKNILFVVDPRHPIADIA
ncbi:hypothetical protein [Thiocapsa bogorovii]|uniref:hypothetical protein n=1 Tax=Thiocapsa bogorovii TaxID=521689 RepID=UPI001E59AA6E|nr:hypothetical protein [Thiocapsa bogorovii]UHD14924.1 hypothetical protein LT988_16775 [Thiocapsa bogorovii]